jgi:hypothetical protein
MTNLALKETESVQRFQGEAQGRPAPDRDSTTPRKRRATGPRTEQGRKRSSRNALSYGLFSSAVILPGESERLYKKLLRGFVKSLQPEGGLEMHLVEKLAQIAWRHRRLLIVEGAESQLGSQFYKRDQEVRWAREAERVEARLAGPLVSRDVKDGLLGLDHNPVALQRCLDLLSRLDSDIRKIGFDTDSDTVILTQIYGAGAFDCKGLRPSYQKWSETAEVSDAERELNGYATSQECVEYFLSDVESERRRLKALHAESALTERDRMKLTVTVSAIPRPERTELLLKYEAAFERAFDRTLSQLERTQRERRGQPQAPRIDVTIATE